MEVIKNHNRRGDQIFTTRMLMSAYLWMRTLDEYYKQTKNFIGDIEAALEYYDLWSDPEIEEKLKESLKIKK